MRILILGGGGREHALAWKLAQSPLCEALIAAPGNPGLAEVARCAPLAIEDPAAVVAFARAEAIDLVVVGPEAPLAAGVSDALAAAGVATFGPSRAAAQLETSKGFAKTIADACGAPTAAWRRFETEDAALAHLAEVGAPIVVKADGLAAGKGVVVAATQDEAAAAVREMFGGRFGAAGAAVVIEEFMTGVEASLFCLCDGVRALPFGSAQDHKRAYDGDQGPNTGGMGAFSPAPALPAEVEARALSEIVHPVLAEMARRGAPYRGVLYAGLMVADGRPRLVEFNARFGDPECQILMRRLTSDLAPLLRAAADGDLSAAEAAWSPDPAVTVVLASKGYPGAYARGGRISGLEAAAEIPGVVVFQAGTGRDEGGALIATGGRVLNVTATGATAADARAAAYDAVGRIEWSDGFHRTDIAARA